MTGLAAAILLVCGVSDIKQVSKVSFEQGKGLVIECVAPKPMFSSCYTTPVTGNINGTTGTLTVNPNDSIFLSH